MTSLTSTIQSLFSSFSSWSNSFNDKVMDAKEVQEILEYTNRYGKLDMISEVELFNFVNSSILYPKEGSIKVLQTILAHNPKLLDLHNSDENCIIHIAAQNHYGLTKWLLEKFPDQINKLNGKGETPLHKAASTLHSKDLVKLLLDNGADAATLDHQGNTALHIAAKESYSEGFKYLYEQHQTQACISNYEGKTPFDIFLIRYGASSAKSVIEAAKFRLCTQEATDILLEMLDPTLAIECNEHEVLGHGHLDFVMKLVGAIDSINIAAEQ